MLFHLDIFACPVCSGRLEPSPFSVEREEMVEGELSCGCGRRYEVARGIPHLLADQPAEPSPATARAAAGGSAAAPPGRNPTMNRTGKSCLVCGCRLGDTRVELCKNCCSGLLRKGLDKKVLAGLYEALESRKESNTYTDYTISDEFVEWLAKNMPSDAAILEIGCGGGYLAEEIRRRGFRNILASDLSGRAVETALARFPGLQGVVMDSALMAFARGSLDCVVSVEMVEHLLDPEQHFDEVARVLKPGGVYLARTPNAIAAALYYRWARRYDMGIWHPSTFSAAALQRTLERRGFLVRHLPPASLPQSQKEKLPRLLKFLHKIPMSLVPLALRPSVCIVATKP